jgi:hypothetical protein
LDFFRFSVNDDGNIRRSNRRRGAIAFRTNPGRRRNRNAVENRPNATPARLSDVPIFLSRIGDKRAFLRRESIIRSRFGISDRNIRKQAFWKLYVMFEEVENFISLYFVIIRRSFFHAICLSDKNLVRLFLASNAGSNA